MLALIAGTGRLPHEVAGRLKARPLICALHGSEPDYVDAELVFRLEHLGSFIERLKSADITEICMAGAVARPHIDPAAIDAATLPLVPILQAALGQGDDGALRAVIQIFEKSGFTVRAAHDVAPDLLLAEGVLTSVQPGEIDKADAARGAEVVTAMAAVDVGQSCAIRNRQAIAIEGQFGTQWMLNSLAIRPDGEGGLLYKAPKPGQERRADLPTIGPDTVEQVAQAALSGIVIEAGGVIVLERDAVVDACDRLGLFLWVRQV
ncbi:hypothetical protein SAMN04488118_103272 [Epibacterium ulvae]|uniref:Phosphatidate cytidylyltransferase n=1 Tax=Epibacterium ulvae TaxID=1156985 RepID=A0A1G5Q906_9RHOB|nr:UDP-2,3-diacylglucosamine diphosphatase LpxI [Epibacterium ulvae]SCZ58365.1 hypothetical protein SAMN04488118_103272 [Epibacterium ulvae]